MMSQQGATARVEFFNLRAGSDTGRDKVSEMVPVKQLPRAGAPALIWGGSVVELSASESLENNESSIEASVSVEPWLG